MIIASLCVCVSVCVCGHLCFYDRTLNYARGERLLPVRGCCTESLLLSLLVAWGKKHISLRYRHIYTNNEQRWSSNCSSSSLSFRFLQDWMILLSRGDSEQLVVINDIFILLNHRNCRKRVPCPWIIFSWNQCCKSRRLSELRAEV